MKLLKYFFMQRALLFFHTGLFLLVIGSNAIGFDQYEDARRRMVKAIEADVRETSFYINKKSPQRPNLSGLSSKFK